MVWRERRIFSKTLEKVGLKHGAVFCDRYLGDIYLEVIVDTLGTEKIVTNTLQKEEKEKKKEIKKKSLQYLTHIFK